MRPNRKADERIANECLKSALTEADDVRYCLLVCEAAEIAEQLEGPSPSTAILIWSQIAFLDPDRGRLHELVDHARKKLQRAGIESPPSIDQEYAAYLATLPEEQRFVMTLRYLQRVAMGRDDATAARKAAKEGLAMIHEGESTTPLSNKLAAFKRIFEAVLKRDA